MEYVSNKLRKNYVIWICAIAIVALFVIFIISRTNKSTFSLEDDYEPKVRLECDDTSLISGGDVSCDIVLDSKYTKILSLNANYSVSSELKYKSFSISNDCVEEECFISLHDSELGFAIGNINGVVGEYTLATVVFSLPTDILPSTQYEIGLTNIELSDDEYVMYEVEDLEVKISTLSDITTLEELNIQGATLNETFNKDVTEYTAILNEGVSSINISTVATQLDSIVSGDVGNVKLDYGTNKLQIVVTSQDGNNQRIYNIEIFREYTFTNDYEGYKYFSDDNYLYVSNDLDNDIISNLNLSDDGLSSIIDNNQLIISREDEKLATIGLIGFKCETCLFIEDKLYVDYDNYDDLMKVFTKNGVSINVYDLEKELVTSGVVTENYIIEITYDNQVLESFTIAFEKLSFDESLIVDEDNMIIKRVAVGTTYDLIFSKINTKRNVAVIDKNGNILSETDKVKTGDIIVLELENNTQAEYEISVLGDTTGDGIIDVNDVGRLYRHVKKVSVMAGPYLAAGDVVKDGEYTVNDVGKLYRYMKKVDNMLEVIPQ